jgi:hypothetical protein
VSARVTMTISDELAQRLKRESIDRDLPVARLAAMLVERNVDKLPPVPWADEVSGPVMDR